MVVSSRIRKGLHEDGCYRSVVGQRVLEGILQRPERA